MESITLYFKQGSSDKVYQATIEEREGGYVVLFAYGRRGTTLTTGTKTSTPVSLDIAKGIYQKLIKEKQAKGYRAGEGNTAYHSPPDGKNHTGIHCQLLTPIEESQVERLINDPAYWSQEKLDGRRMLIQRHDGVVTGINKLGFQVAVPSSIEEAAKSLKEDFLIDGEAIGDVLYAFDLLSIGGRLVTGQGYADRSLHLINLLAEVHQEHILMVRSAFLAGQKRILFEECKKGKKEGVVFKRFDHPYRAGRSDSQFKFKFCESASCIVGKINTRRSIRLEMFDGDKLVSIGNVTIPINQKIPSVGSIVEVRYLYAYQGGSLYQPVYQGLRDDIAMQECTINQLKFKAEAIAA